VCVYYMEPLAQEQGSTKHELLSSIHVLGDYMLYTSGLGFRV